MMVRAPVASVRIFVSEFAMCQVDTGSSINGGGQEYRSEAGQYPVQDEVAVGTIIADRPPHRSARALISACGSYLG